ncbi:MAG: 50S ribosomal protein L25 [Patescibacteria group bacterium]|nr:50S ribosomal protein L25 [Patescibacteria group bacterium]
MKQLRKQGLLPGNIYGKKVKSQAVEIPLTEFRKTYHLAGETKIVELALNDKDVHPVLIHNVQIDPLTRNPIHADFYQVDLKQKVKTNVPVKLVGISPAVTQKIGLLLQTLNEVEVEALPADLPESLTIDVSKLTLLDQELKVSDFKTISGVTILTSPTLSVVKVGKLVSKEAEEIAREEEAAKEAAKAAAAAETATTAQPEAATPKAPSEEAAGAEKPTPATPKA